MKFCSLFTSSLGSSWVWLENEKFIVDYHGLVDEVAHGERFDLSLLDLFAECCLSQLRWWRQVKLLLLVGAVLLVMHGQLNGLVLQERVVLERATRLRHRR